MKNAFLTILNMSLTGSVIIAFVILLRVFLKRLPRKYTYLLWSVPAIRLLCPVSVSSRFSLFNLFNPSLNNGRMEYISDYREVAQEVLPNTDAILPGICMPPIYEEAVVSAVPPHAVVNGSQSIIVDSGSTIAKAPDIIDLIKQADALTIISWIWLAVSIGIIIYSVISWISVYVNVRYSRKENGFKICNGISSPFVFGIIRPEIYLCDGLSTEDRNYILAHERAHIRRLDHISKLLIIPILALHWFNPLVWLGAKLMTDDMELSCDEMALNRLGEDHRAAYARTLLNISMRQNGIRLNGILYFGEKNIKSRIKGVLSMKKPTTIAVIIAIAVLIIASGCMLTNAKPDKNIPANDNDALVKTDWWTASEYEAWISEQRAELEALIGTGNGWYDGKGVYHEWTQETVNAEIAQYEEILEEIKSGVLYAKPNETGDSFAQIPPGDDDFTHSYIADSLVNTANTTVTTGISWKSVPQLDYDTAILNYKGAKTNYCLATKVCGFKTLRLIAKDVFRDDNKAKGVIFVSKLILDVDNGTYQTELPGENFQITHNDISDYWGVCRTGKHPVVYFNYSEEDISYLYMVTYSAKNAEDGIHYLGTTQNKIDAYIYYRASGFAIDDYRNSIRYWIDFDNATMGIQENYADITTAIDNYVQSLVGGDIVWAELKMWIEEEKNHGLVYGFGETAQKTPRGVLYYVNYTLNYNNIASVNAADYLVIWYNEDGSTYVVEAIPIDLLNSNKSIVGTIISIDENGLPTIMVDGGTETYTFGNYCDIFINNSCYPMESSGLIEGDMIVIDYIGKPVNGVVRVLNTTLIEKRPLGTPGTKRYPYLEKTANIELAEFNGNPALTYESESSDTVKISYIYPDIWRMMGLYATDADDNYVFNVQGVFPMDMLSNVHNIAGTSWEMASGSMEKYYLYKTRDKTLGDCYIVDAGNGLCGMICFSIAQDYIEAFSYPFEANFVYMILESFKAER